MAERNALMPGRGLARESNALVPDTLADGSPDPDATAGYQQAYDWRQAQRAQSVAEGYLDPVTGLPTAKGLQGAGNEYWNALLMGTTAPGVRAFHGSPHSFERFDLGKIGTGEGAQAYGHGLYFAEKEGVARGYRDKLSATDANLKVDGRALLRELNTSGNSPDKSLALEALHRTQDWNTAYANVSNMAKVDREYAAAKQWMDTNKSLVTQAPESTGHMYEVNINADPEHFLHWDKPLSEQSPHVQEALGKMGITEPNLTGSEAWLEAVSQHGLLREGAAAPASQALQDAGIPGIRYLDGGSRAAGEGSHNLVVFNPENIEILRKYGLAGLGLGGAAAAGAAQQSGGTDTQ